ncbi:MAG: hypothetical protein ACREBU_04855 [Nitrososphaera sp.]
MEILNRTKVISLAIMFFMPFSASNISAVALEDEDKYQTINVTDNGNEYEIKYSVEGGVLENIADSGLAFTVTDTPPAGGKLMIMVPRLLIDAFVINVFVEIDGKTFQFGNGGDVVDISHPVCETLVFKIMFEKSVDITISGARLLQGDNKPLGDPVSPTLILAEGNFTLPAIMNAKSCDFSLIKEEKTLHIGVEQSGDQQGYLELTIPHMLLGGNYSVWIDNRPTSNFSSSSGANSTTITLEYPPGAESIDIIGTTVIPEFSQTYALMAGSIVAATVTFIPFMRYWRRFIQC